MIIFLIVLALLVPISCLIVGLLTYSDLAPLLILPAIFGPLVFGFWASTLSTQHHRQTFNRACQKAGGEILNADNMICIKKGFTRIEIVIN